MIIIRLVRHNDLLSDAIVADCYGDWTPWEASKEIAHAEAVMLGGTVIGAYAEGGVQERPLDYDHGNFKYEEFVGLPADADMTAKLEHYLRSPEVLGEKYDYTGLFEFAELAIEGHLRHHVFCSALVDDALRGCGYFPRPLPVPAHKINPLFLKQMLYARPDIVIMDRTSPVFLAHIAPKAGAVP